MKKTPHLAIVAVLAGGVSLAALTSGAYAADNGATVPTNPGFNPDSGQLHPADTRPAPSGSPPGDNSQSGTGTQVQQRAPAVDNTAVTNAPIPTPAQARAALKAPDSKDPAIGQVALPQSSGQGTNAGNTGPGHNDATTASQGLAAVGGQLAPGASAGDGGGGSSGGNSGSGGGAAGTGGTTGSASREDVAKEASHQTSAGLPIGSTGQTQPAKFSDRNTTLDRLPMMAWPQQISDEERAQIYKAAMADNTKPAPGADTLKPASQLSTEQVFNDMHPLPQAIGGNASFQKYAYVKGNKKVFLVSPAMRTVIDEIAE